MKYLILALILFCLALLVLLLLSIIILGSTLLLFGRKSKDKNFQERNEMETKRRKDVPSRDSEEA